MTKLAAGLAASAALIAGLAALPQPGLAQAGSRVSEIIVYGNDPCPRSTDDEVVVCARKPEAERYRIPEKLRQGGSLQSRQSWANRAIAFETQLGNGLYTCSPVGNAGFTGCTQQVINQAFKEREEEAKGAAPPEQ